MNQKLFRGFLAGSSFPVVGMPFLLLATVSNYRNVDYIDWSNIVWVFPIVFGLANVLFWLLESKISLSYVKKLWIFGILLGILMPSFGIMNNVPHEVFGFDLHRQFMIYPLAMFFYGCIWRYVIEFMNQIIGISQITQKS